ncbi:hypothetical protein B0H19DRAFT_1080139 [Mycena capillaripes]|nr:hypothetical protein B0H19DRAFT_1080139 [Mycena capillaripes]
MSSGVCAPVEGLACKLGRRGEDEGQGGGMAGRRGGGQARHRCSHQRRSQNQPQPPSNPDPGQAAARPHVRPIPYPPADPSKQSIQSEASARPTAGSMAATFPLPAPNDRTAPLCYPHLPPPYHFYINKIYNKKINCYEESQPDHRKQNKHQQQQPCLRLQVIHHSRSTQLFGVGDPRTPGLPSTSSATSGPTQVKQPIVMRWDPPAVPAPTSTGVLADTQEPEDGPSLQGLAAEVRRLREHVTAISPNPSSTDGPSREELAAEVQRLREQSSALLPPSYSGHNPE